MKPFLANLHRSRNQFHDKLCYLQLNPPVTRGTNIIQHWCWIAKQSLYGLANWLSKRRQVVSALRHRKSGGLTTVHYYIRLYTVNTNTIQAHVLYVDLQQCTCLQDNTQSALSQRHQHVGKVAKNLWRSTHVTLGKHNYTQLALSPEV